MGNVVDEEELLRVREKAKAAGRRFVLTNGGFDLIHAGHLQVLNEAKSHGDLLAVAVNGDESVRTLKGEGRPLVGQDDRALLISALTPVDYVVLFHEETPRRLIERVIPDVLVKGGDYRADEIVGADTVRDAGGEVVVVDFRSGCSTSELIRKISRLPGVDGG
jgi:rfaE bifunctional protein nucleotidyltransferase chain/domain